MSGASTLSEKEVAVRWAAFRTEDSSTADYAMTVSDGESPALAQEVDALCRQFHPVTESPPQDRPVFLFWKTRGTGDRVLTRITHAPGRAVGRPALQYYSLLFSPEEFESIGADPTAVIASDWFDRVQAQLEAGQHQPVEAALPYPRTVQDLENAPVTPIAADQAEKMRAGGVLEAAGENVKALMDYCREQAARSEPPPTFATWWASEKEIPSETFHIVLRSNRHPGPFSTRTGIGAGQKADLFKRRPGTPISDVKEVRTREARAKEAQVREAQLKEVQLREAQVREVQLREAQQREAQVREAQVKEAQVKDAQLKEAQLKEAQAREARAKEVLVKEAQAKEAQAREARVKEAEDREARAKEAEAREAQLKEAQAREAQLKEAQLKEAQLKEAQLKEAQLKEAQAKEAQAKEAQAKEAQAKEAQAREARVKEAQAKEAEAREAQLKEAQAKEVRAKEAQLKEAQLKEAQAREAQLKEAQAREAHLKEAQLKETQLKEAQLKEAQAKEARARAARVKEPAEERLIPNAPIPGPAASAKNPSLPQGLQRVKRSSLITVMVLAVVLAGALLLALRPRNSVSPTTGGGAKKIVPQTKDLASLPPETINSYFAAARDGAPALAKNWAYERALNANRRLPRDQNPGLTRAQVWKVAQDAIAAKVLEQVHADKNTPAGSQLQQNVTQYLDQLLVEQVPKNKMVLETINAALKKAQEGNIQAVHEQQNEPVMSRPPLPTPGRSTPSIKQPSRPRPVRKPAVQKAAPREWHVYQRPVQRSTSHPTLSGGSGHRSQSAHRAGPAHTTSQSGAQSTINHLLH